MDSCEATKIVMSRVQSLDPQNATRIMGFLLMQEQAEKEMIRLAFGSEALLLSCVNQAKAVLGLSSNTASSNPVVVKNPPRILIPNSPSFPRISSKPVSYAAAVNGSSSTSASSGVNVSGSPSLPFCDFADEGLSVRGIGGGALHQDQLVFHDEPIGDSMMSPSGRSDSLIYSFGEDVNTIPSPNPFHRRSCSVNDASYLANLDEGGGFGWRPCMYFARGFCKNGSTCKFLHSDVGGGEAIEGQNISGFDELLRMKALQRQKFALMASIGHFPFAYNKRMNFLNESQRSAAAALVMGDDFNRFNRCRIEKTDFSSTGLTVTASSSSRQIYLTFPADSTFKEEDVSNYFSIFGPVKDVRIPYQQKRMFGFVTFDYPDTVKLILAKGNPHFVCDSRVLVKPYKEKGKVADKKHQHIDIGEYRASLSPTELDSRDHFDVPFGPRMLLNSQENMLRRKLDLEAELQHAVELRGRKMMNLQLMDLKNQQQIHQFLPSMLASVSISSPRQSQLQMDPKFTVSADAIDHDVSKDFEDGKEACKSMADDFNLELDGPQSSASNIDSVIKQEPRNADLSDLSESLGYTLPENLFSSPTKFSAENRSVFFPALTETDGNLPVTSTSSNSNPMCTISSPLRMASLKPCYFQMPSH